MKITFFICDVGSGHLSRTCAVFTELCFFAEITELVVFCGRNIERVKQKFDLLSNKKCKIRYIRYHEHINWFPRQDGTPDIYEALKLLEKYSIEEHKSFFSKYALAIKESSLILNDGWPLANLIAADLGIKCYNTFHFKWSWFFSKCYPMGLITNKIKFLYELEKLSSLDFIMPYTPSEITNTSQKSSRLI